MTPTERIDRLIESLPDWRGKVLTAIRKAIRGADRAIIEEWKWMGSPVWSCDGIIAVANAHKEKVKVTFANGARLPDSHRLFNAGLSGGKWRAIDFYEGDKISTPALKELVRAAIEFNRSGKKTPAGSGKAKASSASKSTTRAKLRAKPKPADGKAGATKKVVLLSGGNPQIAKADGDAPVQAYIAAMPGWKSDLGRRLDALIEQAVPDVRKAVRWNSPFYGVEGEGWFLNFHTFAKYVKVAFFRGAALDPLPPGKSKHADVRYLDIREVESFDEPQFTDWVKQAAALPGWTP